MGPRTHRLDRLGNGPGRGHHDDPGLGAVPQQVLHHVHGAAVGQGRVKQHHL